MTNKSSLKPIATTIDARLLKEFRKAVIDKHGQLFGAYKEELENAIMDRTEKLKPQKKEKKEIDSDERYLRGR